MLLHCCARCANIMQVEQMFDGDMRPTLRALSLVLTFVSSAKLALCVTISAPDSFPSPGPITAQQIYDELTALLPEGVWIAPMQYEEYAILQSRWLRRELSPRVQRTTKSIFDKRLTAPDRAANCNAFTALLRFSAQLAAIGASGRQPAIGALVVMQEDGFGGVSATQELHSVAIARTELGWVVIEAQTGTEVPLPLYPNLRRARFLNLHRRAIRRREGNNK